MINSTRLITLMAPLLVAISPVFAADLRIGVLTEVASIDPHLTEIASDVQIKKTIFEALIHSSQYQKLEPELAESWSVTSDPLVWEFKLRKGVTFHDGSTFDAEDVAFSFKRAPGTKEKPTRYARSMKSIDTVSVIDPYTIHIRTKAFDPLLPAYMTGIMIISSDVGQVEPSDFNSGKAAIGTGPYMFEIYKPGEKIEFKAYKSYWGKAPEWDKVTVLPITSNPSRVSALLSGDVDVINAVPTMEMERLESDPNISVVQTESNRVMFWVPDIARDNSPFVKGNDGSEIKNPMSDIRVRQAITLAIDRDSLIDDVMQGWAVPAYQVVPEQLGGHNPDIEIPSYDLAGAKKLMADAGYADGFKLTIHATNNRYINDGKLAQGVGQMLARLGIDVTVETQPVTGYYGRARKKEMSMFMVGWGSTSGEASKVMRPALTSGSINNYGGYENAEFNRLFTQASQTLDTEERNALLGEAMAIAMDEVAIIPTHFQVNIWASRKGFQVVPRTDELTLPTYIKSSK